MSEWKAFYVSGKKPYTVAIRLSCIASIQSLDGNESTKITLISGESHIVNYNYATTLKMAQPPISEDI